VCTAGPLFGAGGIAFGTSGKLYVALLAKNQLSILKPDGTEISRFPSPEQNAQRDIPVNTPFGLAFNARGSSLLATTGDPPPGQAQPSFNESGLSQNAPGSVLIHRLSPRTSSPKSLGWQRRRSASSRSHHYSHANLRLRVARREVRKRDWRRGVRRTARGPS